MTKVQNDSLRFDEKTAPDNLQIYVEAKSIEKR